MLFLQCPHLANNRHANNSLWCHHDRLHDFHPPPPLISPSSPLYAANMLPCHINTPTARHTAARLLTDIPTAGLHRPAHTTSHPYPLGKCITSWGLGEFEEKRDISNSPNNSRCREGHKYTMSIVIFISSKVPTNVFFHHYLLFQIMPQSSAGSCRKT